jgi:hypothetical protein
MSIDNKSTQNWWISHLMAFGMGIAVGHNWNLDELNAYRSSHETWSSKIRRQATRAAMAIASMAAVVIILRININRNHHAITVELPVSESSKS